MFYHEGVTYEHFKPAHFQPAETCALLLFCVWELVGRGREASLDCVLHHAAGPEEFNEEHEDLGSCPLAPRPPHSRF